MGLSPLFVTHVLEPHDLPLTCLGSVETIGNTQTVGRRVRSRWRPRPNPRHRIQVTNKGHTVSPGKWLAKMEEPAARAVVGESGELRARLATLTNFHRRIRATHIGLYPARVR